MPAGQTPHTVVLFAHNDLVDKVQPGDRVNVTGKMQFLNSIWLIHVPFFSLDQVVHSGIVSVEY